MEGFLRYRFGGLIFEGAYFQNFTVLRCIFNFVLRIIYIATFRNSVS